MTAMVQSAPHVARRKRKWTMVGRIGVCIHNPPARHGTANNPDRNAGGRRRKDRNGNAADQQNGEHGVLPHPSGNSLCLIEIEVTHWIIFMIPQPFRVERLVSQNRQEGEGEMD